MFIRCALSFFVLVFWEHSPGPMPRVTGRRAGVTWRVENSRLVVTVDSVGAYAAVVIEGRVES